MGGDGCCIFSTFVDVVGFDALFVARQTGPSLSKLDFFDADVLGSRLPSRT
jgi:hypothetical protein